MLDGLSWAVNDHEPRVRPMAERLLGHQVTGHLVIEWEGSFRHRGSS